MKKCPRWKIRAVAEESLNIMAVWGMPEDCIEKIKFYADSIQPEHLMLNIASGSLPQDKVLKSVRLIAGAGPAPTTATATSVFVSLRTPINLLRFVLFPFGGPGGFAPWRSWRD